MTLKAGGSRTVTRLAAAVLVLLPVLAALQYRWLGQVSEHERDRLRRTLGNATGAVARDLDAALARAIDRLPIDQLADRQLAPADAPAPATGAGIVDRLYFVERQPDDDVPLILEACALDASTCAATGWPAELLPLRDGLAASFRRGSDHDLEELSQGVATPAGKRPIVVVPVERRHEDSARRRGRDRRLAGAALVGLSQTALRAELVPSLVNRHFGGSGDSDFRVAIVDWARPLDVIYDGTDGQLEALLGDPEAWQELFTLRIDEFADRRSASEGAHGSGAGFAKAFGRRRGGDGEEWLLVARHREGSLQTAVDNLRRRNLLLISGILALMGVAVALIALSSRRAQRLAEQQVEFVAGVSHELRTPVATIHLAAQNLADGMVTDPQRMQRYGATIMVETERLRNTVERVLQFAALSGRRRASGPRASVALGPLVHDAVETVRRDHPGAEIAVALPGDLPIVPGDAADLNACLTNLLVNAVKYGGPDARIQLAAAMARTRRGSELRLTVHDSGAAIDPEDLPHLFEPFYRGRNALRRRIQGNGLGLHIVKRIVEDHGGRVAVQSTPADGTTFTVRLPLDAAAASAARAVPAPAVAEAEGAPSQSR